MDQPLPTFPDFTEPSLTTHSSRPFPLYNLQSALYRWNKSSVHTGLVSLLQWLLLMKFCPSTLASVHSLSLIKETLLPCCFCISHVFAMSVPTMGSFGYLLKEWMSAYTELFTAEHSLRSAVHKTHSPHPRPLMFYSFLILAHGSTSLNSNFSAFPGWHS